jgi:hypothetical protein
LALLAAGGAKLAVVNRTSASDPFESVKSNNLNPAARPSSVASPVVEAKQTLWRRVVEVMA